MDNCMRLRRFAFNCNQLSGKSNFLRNFKNEEFMNDYITSLCEQRSYREALEAFDFVRKNTSFPIGSSTYAKLICACSSLRSLTQGRKIHDHILKSNCKPDIILCNHILNMYGKCGSLWDARKVFDHMTQRNSVTYTSIITGYSQHGQEVQAIELFSEMLLVGLVPDHFALGSVIRACAGLGDIGLGKQLHAHVIKSETNSQIIAQNALIAMYTNFNKIYDASKVFSGIAVKDLISWSSIITGFSKLGHEYEALSYFKKLLSYGVFQPNQYIFGSAFNACSSLLRPDYGSQIHGLCIKSGLSGDVFAGCSLCDMYARCGLLNSAKTVFCQIERPDTASWNAIIAGLANNGNTNEAISFFSRMRNSGCVTDVTTLRSLLGACTSPVNLSQGMQIHSYIIKTGFQSHSPVCNSLITMYASWSYMYSSFSVFEEIKNKTDSVSWNTILKACLQHKRAADILRLFKLMLISECKPDHATVGNVLGACVEISSLELGSQVHAYNMKTGLMCDRFITNGLIDMYAKCGSLGLARRLFDAMENADVVSWSTLIVGYAQSGFGEKALKLFWEMRDVGVDPNQVTFLGAFTACSHVGLVEEGLKLYRDMQTEYGIEPTIEHCSCMVDLIARAGYLNEAETFINQMKLEPDVVVWKTLLAACKTQRNVDLAKRVAENILKIDPSNSTAYVLLCNMHASSGNWTDVALMRSSMKKQDVKKIPGQSWIEVKDKIHSFVAEDVLHPERVNLYTVLHELCMHMQDEGYVPQMIQSELSHKSKQIDSAVDPQPV